jgi:hypothetical protein
MLARKRFFKVGDDAWRTPIILPSFSSKGVSDVKKIVQVSAEYISDEILISAYDLHYNNIDSSKVDYASLVFLDSGGYEARLDTDFSDNSKTPHNAKHWTKTRFLETVRKWEFDQPTVLVSYDSPKSNGPLDRQISSAKKLQKEFPGACVELLIKPENSQAKQFNEAPIGNICKKIHDLAPFQIIGVTEKELGRSLLDRMNNIAKIRGALDNVGLKMPIHIFGSLDPLTSPLYFLAGADIFDGLTWLRYGYTDGFAVYKQNYSAKHLDLDMTETRVNPFIHQNNYSYGHFDKCGCVAASGPLSNLGCP